MDTQTRRDMETMAEWASTQDAYDRLLERRARRRRWLRFIFNWRQIVDDPTVAAPVPAGSSTHPRSPVGTGTGAARVRAKDAGTALSAGNGESSPRAALPPPLASRISAGVTWT